MAVHSNKYDIGFLYIAVYSAASYMCLTVLCRIECGWPPTMVRTKKIYNSNIIVEYIHVQLCVEYPHVHVIGT